jgi:large subunit ribosomal protein L13
MEDLMINIGTKTFSAKKEDLIRKWYLIDAKDKTLGRLSTEVAKILRGKNKVIFTPHVDCGDFVIIINANKIKVTGNKLEQKNYYRHSGYIGNLKVTNLEKMLKKSPEFVIKNAVKGMIPHNTLGRAVMRKLKVYAGETHPHESQKPEVLEV